MCDCTTILPIFVQLSHSVPVINMYMCLQTGRKTVWILISWLLLDQLASKKPADLDIHCFQSIICEGFVFGPCLLKQLYLVSFLFLQSSH